jgi:hypothetical protein
VKWSAHTLFAAGATVTVVAVVAVGLFLNGNPAEVRRQRLDEQRISDLRALSNAVDAYTLRQQRLPENLAALEPEERFSFVRSVDLATGQPYEYRVTSERTYELCASFDTTGGAGSFYVRTSLFGGVAIQGANPSFWDHGPGRHCFEFTARLTQPAQR